MRSLASAVQKHVKRFLRDLEKKIGPNSFLERVGRLQWQPPIDRRVSTSAKNLRSLGRILPASATRSSPERVDIGFPRHVAMKNSCVSSALCERPAFAKTASARQAPQLDVVDRRLPLRTAAGVSKVIGIRDPGSGGSLSSVDRSRSGPNLVARERELLRSLTSGS